MPKRAEAQPSERPRAGYPGPAASEATKVSERPRAGYPGPAASEAMKVSERSFRSEKRTPVQVAERARP